jgi:hypothetical protein
VAIDRRVRYIRSLSQVKEGSTLLEIGSRIERMERGLVSIAEVAEEIGP